MRLGLTLNGGYKYVVWEFAQACGPTPLDCRLRWLNGKRGVPAHQYWCYNTIAANRDEGGQIRRGAEGRPPPTFPRV